MNIYKTLTIIGLLLATSACNSNGKKSAAIIETPTVVEVPLPEDPCSTIECQNSNKYVVEKIYSDVINAHTPKQVHTYYHESVVQHNPNIDDGTLAQEAYFTQLSSDNPDHIATIKHLVADDEYVAVHWHYSASPDNEFSGSSMVDVYKLDGGLIVEQWNIAMSLGESTVSGNSAFSDLYVYDNAPAIMTDETEDANNEMVTTFYLDLFNNANVDLVDEKVDVDYLQHNVWVPNGSAALKSFVSNRTPGGLDIFLSLAEGDLVWTFSKNENLTLVDIWRVDYNEGKIVEHWDLF
jgi:predicted SnoaL-like aldol condensation-catalyzing enzyme